MPVDVEKYEQAKRKRQENKTDQLNADDLLVHPITVAIEDVQNGTSIEQPLSLIISGGHKPYKPCHTMRKLLEFAWRDKDPNSWIGKSLTLFRDADVMNMGEVVGGIRISHVSHIDKPETCKLNEKRGHRKVYTVHPIAAQPVSKAKAKPKATHPVVVEWGPRFKDAPPTVLAICSKIREGAERKDPQILSDCEPALEQIEDHDWRVKLKDFLTAVLDHANAKV